MGKNELLKKNKKKNILFTSTKQNDDRLKRNQQKHKIAATMFCGSGIGHSVHWKYGKIFFGRADSKHTHAQ